MRTLLGPSDQAEPARAGVARKRTPVQNEVSSNDATMVRIFCVWVFLQSFQYPIFGIGWGRFRQYGPIILIRLTRELPIWLTAIIVRLSEYLPSLELSDLQGLLRFSYIP